MSSRFFSALAALSFGLTLSACLQANGETCQLDSDCQSALCCKPGGVGLRGVCAAMRDDRCPPGGTADAGITDAGMSDAGMTDAGMSEDAGMTDAGMSEDAAMSDAGMSDAGMSDAGTSEDAAMIDANIIDASTADVGVDAGTI